MAYLEITAGPLKGNRFTISGKTTIGRNLANHLHLDDASVSRRHAEIWPKENYYVLVDVGSANGTFVNGEPLHRFVPRPLYEKDKITLGGSEFIFHAEGANPPGTDKKKPSFGGTKSDKCDLKAASPLSVVMTHEGPQPLVNATLDASRALLFDPSNETPERLLHTIKRLQAMVQVAIDLGTLLKPGELAERIMQSIFDVFPHADRAFIMTQDKKSGELIPLSARGRAPGQEGATDVFPVSHTILHTVVSERRSILLSDALSDARFADQRSIVDLSIRSLMCAPFICKEELLGVIGVDTTSRHHAFSADDLAMLTGIASQAAIALKNSELFCAVETETQIRTHLSRYLSRDVVEGVIDGTIPLRLGGEKKYGTILFCDIVGFTGIAEKLPALDVVEKLNRYYSLVADIITRNRGTLHKFAGDMVMAFWNVMVPDKKACYNSVRCSLEMQNLVFLFDIQLMYEGQQPLHLGIGCNTGEFAGGNIGGAERMEYTVIGDNVNLAQRIESLASRWQVLISGSTFESIKNLCSAVRLPPVLVKGRLQPITVYSIRGIFLDDNSTLLTIPLVIMTPEGENCGSGLAIRLLSEGASKQIHIVSAATVPLWTNLLIQFDLPELAVSPRLAGTIHAAYRTTTGDGKASYSNIILSELSGDTEAIALLKPGVCIESRKSWRDMKRH